MCMPLEPFGKILRIVERQYIEAPRMPATYSSRMIGWAISQTGSLAFFGGCNVITEVISLYLLGFGFR